MKTIRALLLRKRRKEEAAQLIGKKATDENLMKLKKKSLSGRTALIMQYFFSKPRETERVRVLMKIWVRLRVVSRFDCDRCFLVIKVSLYSRNSCQSFWHSDTES